MSSNFLFNKGHVLKREVVSLVKKFAQFSNVSGKDITSDYTVQANDSGGRLLVDGSNNNVIITLPAIITSFLNKLPIEIYRVDSSPTNVRSISITNIAYAGGIATVTTYEDHNMIVGQAPDIRGVVESEFNINQAIILTVPASNQFTINVAGTPVASPDVTNAFMDIVYRVRIVGTGGNFGVNENMILDDLKPQVNVFATSINWLIDGETKLDRDIARQNQSTTLTRIDGPLDTMFTNNGDGTFNLNHAGSGIVVDRSNPFEFTVHVLNWLPQSNVSTPPGTLISIYINKKNEAVGVDLPASRLSLLDKDNGFDANRLLQIGFSRKTGGVLDDVGADMPAIQYTGNLGIVKANIERNMLGTVRSIRNPIKLLFNSGALTAKLSAGDTLFENGAWSNSAFDGVHNPDSVSVEEADTLFVYVDRLNNIVGADVNFDVLNYESPIGTLIEIEPNKAALRFSVEFADDSFTAVAYGQNTENTTQLVMDSPEKFEIPSILIAGGALNRTAVFKNETNSDNFINEVLDRIILE